MVSEPCLIWVWVVTLAQIEARVARSGCGPRPCPEKNIRPFGHFEEGQEASHAHRETSTSMSTHALGLSFQSTYRGGSEIQQQLWWCERASGIHVRFQQGSQSILRCLNFLSHRLLAIVRCPNKPSPESSLSIIFSAGDPSSPMVAPLSLLRSLFVTLGKP